MRFLTYIKRYNLLITIALFLCALLSKETAIVLFVLFILFDTISELPKMTIAEIFKKYFKIWFLFFGLISIYIILRFLVFGGTFSQGGQAGIFQGKNFIILFATMIKAFGRYLSLLVIPVHLSPDYNDFLVFTFHFFETNVMLSFVILTVTFISAIFLFKLNPTITYGIFWIFVALMPVSNIIPIGAILAERFLYLPSVGFSFFISGILSSISSKA